MFRACENLDLRRRSTYEILYEITGLAGRSISQKMQKFMQNPYMHALRVCFTIILPMIMVGSLASLVNTFRNFAPWLPDLSLINSFFLWADFHFYGVF